MNTPFTRDTHPAVGTFVEAAGIQTNYHEMGEGFPIVLLHGSGAGVTGWENWRSVMPALAQRYRVLAPDIVGFGFTERPEGTTYTIKLWVQHLLGFMDAMDIAKAVIIGNSFGGAMGLAAAIRNGHRIERMVLMGTPAGDFERKNGDGSWYYEPSMDTMGQLLRQFPNNPSIVTDEMIRNRYEVTQLAGGMEAYRRLFPEPGREGETRTVKGIPESELARIATPILALHGREDRMVPLECGIRIARSCPNADLHTFANCGHWVQLERKAQFLEQTFAFLAGL